MPVDIYYDDLNDDARRRLDDLNIDHDIPIASYDDPEPPDESQLKLF